MCSQNCLDLRTELAILKDEKRKLVDEIIEKVQEVATYRDINPGMCFPSYSEDRHPLDVKQEILKILKELKQ